MLADMEAELLAKAEASPNFRKMVIGLAEEAAERRIIWSNEHKSLNHSSMLENQWWTKLNFCKDVFVNSQILMLVKIVMRLLILFNEELPS